MERITKSGDGWRVGWHPHSAKKYQGLVGAEDWAFELTLEELKDFYRLLSQLVDTMNQMTEELMDEEKISCEAETDLLWMEVTGYSHSYTLRLIINSNRACEGNWSPGIAPQLLKAFDSIGFG